MDTFREILLYLNALACALMVGMYAGSVTIGIAALNFCTMLILLNIKEN